jgi:hypothetical protein
LLGFTGGRGTLRTTKEFAKLLKVSFRTTETRHVEIKNRLHVNEAADLSQFTLRLSLLRL